MNKTLENVSNKPIKRIGKHISKGQLYIDLYYGNNEKKSIRWNDYVYVKIEYADKLLSLVGDNNINVDFHKKYGIFNSKNKCYRVEILEYKYKDILKKEYDNYLCEADCASELNFIREKNVKFDSHRDIAFVDIELWQEGDNENSTLNVEKPIHPITLISIYSTKNNKYILIYWHPDLNNIDEKYDMKEEGDTIYISCNNEECMLNIFFNIVNVFDFDILSGYYCNNFDFPYLFNRCKHLGINYNNMSPIGKVKYYNRSKSETNDYYININGRELIDYFDIIKDSQKIRLSNYKLDTAAREIISSDYGKTKIGGFKDWKNNLKKFLEYGKRDVDILKQIEDKIGLLRIIISVQCFSNIINLNHYFSNTILVDSMILTNYKKDIVFPTRKVKLINEGKYSGAIVYEPKKGLYRNIYLFDYTSLYPSILVTFNISPDTYITTYKYLNNKLKGDYAKNNELFGQRLKEKYACYIDSGYVESSAYRGYYFKAQSNMIGVIPEIVKNIFQERINVKKRLKKINKKDKDYEKLNHYQFALKILLNSIYGVLGNKYFRLYSRECADAVTTFGRLLLEFAKHTFEDKFKGECIAGDTDSIFLKFKEEIDLDIDEILSKYKDYLLNDFVKLKNSDIKSGWNLLNLEYQKKFDYIYFPGSKKRYYAIDNKGDSYIRGLNVIRKDTPNVLKNKLNELMKLSVLDKMTFEVIDNLFDRIKTYNYSDIGVYKSFSKSFNLYTKNIPQHLKGVKFTQQYIKSAREIFHTNIPLMFYIINKVDNSKDKSDVVCLVEEDLYLIDKSKDIFEIDYLTFFNKQVLVPMEEFSLISTVKNSIDEFKRKYYSRKKDSRKNPSKEFVKNQFNIF